MNGRLVHLYRDIYKDHDIHKISYQTTFLNKIYKNTGILSSIEFIGLERYPSIVITLIITLEYLYNQNENNIRNISVPNLWMGNDRLILDNFALQQLNIITCDKANNTKLSSLINLVCHTSTACGKRYLHDRIVLPFIDETIIHESYNKIDKLRQIIDKPKPDVTCLDGHVNYYLFQKYEEHLNQVVDIERLHRKIAVTSITPSEFTYLNSSYLNILEVLKLDNENDLLTQLNTIINAYATILDLEECLKFSLNNLKGSIFVYGLYKDLDIIEDQILEYDDFNDELAKAISKLVSKTTNEKFATSEFSDDVGYYIEITTCRYESFLKNLKASGNTCLTIGHHTVSIDSFDISKHKNGKTCHVTCTLMKSFTDKVKVQKSFLGEKVMTIYKSFLESFWETHQDVLKKIVMYISEVDFYKSCAKTSLLYNYCRPIISGEMQSSFIRATNIRHPLIECFQHTVTYVAQNVNLSGDSSGVLLFGINASGKSSYIKTIGMLTIMAQSGMYVPADIFIYKPYTCILTRILGHDDLFKALSSFAVEMLELRSIITRATHNALILGDEVCHGTESTSATAIVAAAIVTLSKIKSSFIFATHLHNLSTLPVITSIKNLKMCHLKVKYENDILIYDRRLAEGAGSSIYGLEIARAMNIPALMTTKKSNYNSQLYINECSIPNCKRRAIDTHHIRFQSHADSTGYIGHIQKNHKSNLISLCKPCHQLVHAGKFIIHGFVSTTSGVKLNYEIIDVNPIKVPMCEKPDTI